MRCLLKGPATLSSVNKHMNSVTKSAASIILRLKLSPLAFNWFPAPPKGRVSKKAQRTRRPRGEEPGLGHYPQESQTSFAPFSHAKLKLVSTSIVKHFV